MNTQKLIFSLAVMGLAILSGLFYLATEGSTIAAAVLFSLWTILCVVIGWGLSIIQQRSATAKEQQAFMNNARENLAIMGAMQTVQNKQSAGLMAQLNQAARLPAQAAPGGFLSVEDGIFSELEN